MEDPVNAVTHHTCTGRHRFWNAEMRWPVVRPQPVVIETYLQALHAYVHEYAVSVVYHGPLQRPIIQSPGPHQNITLVDEEQRTNRTEPASERYIGRADEQG